jgi:hypothetical protein
MNLVVVVSVVVVVVCFFNGENVFSFKKMQINQDSVACFVLYIQNNVPG